MTAWTPTAIRAATPFPKPQGARDAVFAEEAGNFGPPLDLSPLERQILRHIANKADLLNIVTPDEYGHAEHWLLISAPSWIISALAAFEVEREDLEDGADAEPDADREPDTDLEPDHDAEVQTWEHWVPCTTLVRRSARRAS